MAAERTADGAIVGWVSGYLMPDEPETLFIWQVAVDGSTQGQGVAKRMLGALLKREACTGIRRLKTTITPDNAASWALFKSFARSQGAELRSTPYFRENEHFEGEHPTEHMVTIALPQEARSAA